MMKNDTVKFGIIGLGLMGREFASSVARWCNLLDFPVRPEIVAICDVNDALFPWYTSNFSSIKQQTNDYRELLQNSEVEAVFCAVPHNLHEEIYCAIIESGKHLMGEKPFGIDKQANEAILKTIAAHTGMLRPQHIAIPVLPGGSAHVRDDRVRRVRADHRSELRIQAFE